MRIIQSAHPDPKVIDERDEISLDKHESEIVDANQQRQKEQQQMYQRIEQKREEMKRRQEKMEEEKKKKGEKSIEEEKKKKGEESKMTREEWIASMRNGGKPIERSEEQLKKEQEKKQKQEEEKKKQGEEKKKEFNALDAFREADRIMKADQELTIEEQLKRIEELPQTVQRLDELGIGELVILPIHPQHKLKRVMPRIPKQFPVGFQMDDMWECADKAHAVPGKKKTFHFPGDDRIGVIIYSCTNRNCYITVCSVCAQRNVEENLEWFQKLKEEDEQKELLKQKQEEDRKNGIGAEEVKLGETVKIPQHEHELHRVVPKEQSLEDQCYWLCNGTEMIKGGCKSGFQEIWDAQDDPFYTCEIEECDIDFCENCLKHFLEQQQQ